MDQPRFDHTPSSEALRQAVLLGARGAEFASLEQGEEYVAVHIRRPARTNEIGPDTHPDRWLTVEWYAQLIGAIRHVEEFSECPVRVYSLGEPSSFVSLAALKNVEVHLNGERDSDFVQLAAARLLVAAPSSFSFNAALVSRGAVLVRVPWWHHLPNEGRWVHMDSAGEFQAADMRRAVSSSFLLRPRGV
ncbi:hypothetical protein [Microbacterium testaceum]|uniref:hypothetical protein n=1 Tax=Microbacterium testaceum TaxID=2033 RepID=UPI00128FB433|nr:hypothetical protein [Microbacterium testaceum]